MFRDIDEIQVLRNEENKLAIYNPTDYPLIGKGRHGAVFKLDPNICVKIFADESHAQIEGDVYKRVNGSPIIPKLYDVNKRYIVMEYIEGPNLKEYFLKKKGISNGDCRRILNLFKEMKKLGFLRLDESLRHILVSNDKALKIVDLYYSYTLNDPYPVKFLKQLRDIELLSQFTTKLKECEPSIYIQWKSAMPSLVI